MRPATRRMQLAAVIDHHRDLYDQINREFVAQGRYVRIAGNHDQDLQDPSFLALLRTVYPELDQVYDFLVLEPSDDAPGVLIGHGHHFDTASTPLYAPQIGEMLSECLGWAYEGADRVWRWGNGDGVEEWADGREAFNNTLVTDEPDPYQLSSDTVTALTRTLEALFLPQSHGIRSRPRSSRSYPPCWSSSASPACSRTCSTATSPGSTSAARIPGKRCSNEVFCGNRWFKFRHLDEVFIDEQLTRQEQEHESAFGSDPPYLLLGHSHEPRHHSWNPATDTQSDRYLNCGSAGRFQNLIWCTEIIDGVPQIAAWHRPGGPRIRGDRRAAHIRARSRRRDGNAHRVRRACTGARRRGEAEEERRTWLPPVLHMMMTLTLTGRTRRLWPCSAARRSPRSLGTIIRASSWLSGSTGPPRRKPPWPARPSSSSGTGRSAGHFRIEEELLLPALARHHAVTGDAVVRVLTDHVELRRRAADLEAEPEPTVEALHELGACLHDHIRHEERGHSPADRDRPAG